MLDLTKDQQKTLVALLKKAAVLEPKIFSIDQDDLVLIKVCDRRYLMAADLASPNPVDPPEAANILLACSTLSIAKGWNFGLSMWPNGGSTATAGHITRADDHPAIAALWSFLAMTEFSAATASRVGDTSAKSR